MKTIHLLLAALFVLMVILSGLLEVERQNKNTKKKRTRVAISDSIPAPADSTLTKAAKSAQGAD